MIDVTVPQLGESVTEGTITKWLVKEGDVVVKDQPIAEIATDKADSELPAPAGGRVARLLAKEGDVVPVRSVICELDENAAGTAAPLSLNPQPRLRGWPWFQPYHDGEKLVMASDAGAVGLFGIRQIKNEDAALFPLLAEEFQMTAPVAGGSTFEAGRAQVVQAQEDDFWVLAILAFYLPQAAVVIHLNRRMPLEGGLYQWAKAAFGEFVGFLVAWNLWVFAIVIIASFYVMVARNL